MGRGFKKFQSILLIGALLAGISAPMGHVQAQSSMEIDIAENFAELQEEMSTSAVEVSDADRAYWTKFGSDYYYNSLTEEEKILWDGLEEACLKAVVGTEDITKVGCYDRRLSYYEEELGG